MQSNPRSQSEEPSRQAGLAKEINENPFCNPKYLNPLEGIEGLRLKLGEEESETERGREKRGFEFL